MKSKFRVTFADGSTQDVESENAMAAKTSAKNDRIRDVDPGRSMYTADLRRHDRVKVTNVEEISAGGDADRSQTSGDRA